MKLELEIPLSDFKRLVKELNEYSCNCQQGSKNIFVRNQIIEEGGYNLEFQVKKGYCHDTAKLENNGKVVIKIDTVPKE